MVTTEYEAVIGLEVHVQLRTKSKMFCPCRADYQTAPPNTLVCPVCLGMPGVLPVINKKAVQYTIATGLVLDCQVAALTKFDRKNYPYPDLMKGYQISQYDAPIATDGCVEVEVDGENRRIGITRVHLEEDVAKLQHCKGSYGESYSLVDVNRSGVPLMEIVGEPDIRSPEEARQYLTTLRSILQYIGVSTGNMEEGSFRCDANISIRPLGSQVYMTRAEVKNMNSFRAVYNALVYELERQKSIVENGGRVIQETRGWVEERGVTVSQRTKEHAHDYRYFPEPDLPPLAIGFDWVDEIKSNLPELPTQRRNRFVEEYGLPIYDANLLTADRDSADFFEAALTLVDKGVPDVVQRAKSISNWMLGDVMRLLNLNALTLSESKLAPRHIAELIELIDSGVLSITMAKAALEESFKSGVPLAQLVRDADYAQISDTLVVEEAVKRALIENQKAVSDYITGKETAAKFLVGQTMRLTEGRANPSVVNDLIKKALESQTQD